MTTMTDAFKGKIALVTGGNSGIGFALCEELQKRGAIVYMAGRNPAKVAEAAKKLTAQGDRIHTVIVDVTKQAEVQKAIEDTAAQAGRLDFLFNNAGISQKNPYEQSTLADWKEMIDINLWGVIHGVNAALPIMLRQKGGHIINTSSVAALYGTPYQSLYVATKSAVLGLTDCLYYEYLPQNIFFTVVCPGDVATPIFRGHIPEGAVPVEKAAQITLDGVAKRDRMVVFPDAMADLLEKCKDPVFRDLAHKYSEQQSREKFASPD